MKKMVEKTPNVQAYIVFRALLGYVAVIAA